MTGIVAMTHAGYVAAGWLATLGGLGTYGWLVIRRGRRLSEVVPPDERRWSS